MHTTNYFPWLTLIVVLPIFAGSLIFFLPHLSFFILPFGNGRLTYIYIR